MSEFNDDQDNLADPFGNPAEGEDPTDDMVMVGSAPPEPQRRGRPLIAFGAAALVVLVIGGGALALRSFLSTSVAAAEVMPAGTEIFVSIDFLQFIEGDARKLNDTVMSMIEAATDEVGVTDVDDLVARMDDALEEALGVDFTDDIRPWIGRTVSLAVSGFDDLVTGDVPDVLLVVETRDPGSTDAFLDDFAAGLERATNVTVVEDTHAGVPIFVVLDPADMDEPLVFGRVDSVVVMGTRKAVEGAIAVQPGDSLADSERFVSVMDALPPDRVVTFFADGSLFSEALAMDGLDPEPFADLAYDAVGGALSIAEYGIRAESIVLGDDPAMGMDFDSGNLVADLPAGTLAMFGGWSLASYWDAVAPALAGADLDDVMTEARAELGFDPEALLRLLDSPSAFALVEARDGLLAGESGFPIGLLAALGTSQPSAVEGYLDDIAAYVEASGFEGLVKTSAGSGTFWVADGDEAEVVVIGVTDRYLVAASSLSIAESIGAAPSLAENATFREVAEVMAVDPGSILFFADPPAMIEIFDAPPDVAAALAPLGAMAASSEVRDDRMVGTFVWMIDYVDG